MTRTFRSWRESRRYRVILRRLQVLSGPELKALGISPDYIPHLAREAARV